MQNQERAEWLLRDLTKSIEAFFKRVSSDFLVDQMKLIEFAEWINERCKAIEAHVLHTLARVRAEMIAFVAKRARDRQNRLRCEVKRVLSDIFSQSSQNVSQQLQSTCSETTSQQLNTDTSLNARKFGLEAAIKLAKKEVFHVARHLKQSSTELRFWRDASGGARRFISDCKTQQVGTWSACSVPNLDFVECEFGVGGCDDKILFFSHERHRKHPTSVLEAALVTAGKISTFTEFASEYSQSEIWAMCGVEQYAIAVLLYTDKPGKQLELHLIDPAGRILACTKLEHVVGSSCLYSLFASRHHVMAVCHKNAQLINYKIKPSQDSAGACVHVLSEKRRHVIGDGDIITVSHSSVCAHLLAVYQQKAVLLQYRKQVFRRRALIHNEEKTGQFASCAISARGFCLIATAIGRHSFPSYRVSIIRLFDFNGVPITHFNCNSCDSPSFSEAMLFPYSNVALLEKRNESKLLFLYVAADTRSLQCVRLLSTRRVPLKRMKAVSDWSSAELKKESTLRVKPRKLLERQHLRMAADSRTPFVTSVAESASALFLLDIINNVVKRYDKTGSCTVDSTQAKVRSLYRPCQGGFNHEFLTGMCVLDEHTLLVVVNNTHLKLVNSISGECTNTVRYADFRTSSFLQRTLVLTTGAKKLLLAIAEDSRIAEVSCSGNASDWTVSARYLLPHKSVVRYIHFDALARRFAVVICSYQTACKGERVFVANRTLTGEGFYLPYVASFEEIAWCVLLNSLCVCGQNKASGTLIYSLATDQAQALCIIPHDVDVTVKSVLFYSDCRCDHPPSACFISQGKNNDQHLYQVTYHQELLSDA